MLNFLSVGIEWENKKLALTMSGRSPHILSVHVMDRRAIHPTQCLQSATKHAVHWAKGGQYPSETTVTAAPSDILKLINCSCSSDRPCSWQICSCSAAQLACSLFCKCEGSLTCCNPKTVSLVQLYKKLNTTWTLTVILLVTTLTQMGAIVTTVNSALEMPTHIHLGSHINYHYLHECHRVSEMFGMHLLTLGLSC